MIAIRIKLVPLAIIERVLPQARAHLRLVPGEHDEVPFTTHVLLSDWADRCDELTLDGDSPSLSRGTRVGYQCGIDNLLDHLPDVGAMDLLPSHVSHAIAAISKLRGPSAAGSAKYQLSAAWQWAVDNRKVPNVASPTAKVRTAAPNRRRETWIPRSLVIAIILASQELADERRISVVGSRAIEVAARTGLRKDSDILPLRVGQFDAGTGLLSLYIHKSRVYRRIPVSAEAADVLLQCEADAPLTGWLFPGRKGKHITDTNRQWARVLDRVERPDFLDKHRAYIERAVTNEDGVVEEPLNFARFDVHDVRGKRIVQHHLRHAFAAHCLHAGMPQRDVMAALGQTDPSSVNAYAAICPIVSAGPANAFARLIRGHRTMSESQPTTTFAERLRAAAGNRTAAQLSEVLTAAGYVIGARQAENLLKGSSKPPGPDELAMICRALGCSSDVLLGLSNG